MKGEDHIKGYATAAFRFYKSVGGLKAYKQKVWDEAMANSSRQNWQFEEYNSTEISKPTEAQIMRAERALKDARADIYDLEAVEQTLYIISTLSNGRAIGKAVEIVYFTDLDTPLNKRGFIRGKVISASLDIPAGESTVYKYLKKARLVFAMERGLRL